MDIDIVTTAINAMSYEERGEFLRKGLCFYCKQPGHISRNCPEKEKLYQNQQNNNRAPLNETTTKHSLRATTTHSEMYMIRSRKLDHATSTK